MNIHPMPVRMESKPRTRKMYAQDSISVPVMWPTGELSSGQLEGGRAKESNTHPYDASVKTM